MGRVSLLCNDAELFEEDGKWKVEGDPTEGALYPFAVKLGMDMGFGMSCISLSITVDGLVCARRGGMLMSKSIRSTALVFRMRTKLVMAGSHEITTGHMRFMDRIKPAAPDDTHRPTSSALQQAACRVADRA